MKDEILNSLKTTKLGFDRIRKNLNLADFSDEQILDFCRKIIEKSGEKNIEKRGKNYYIYFDLSKSSRNFLTINSHSFTIITAHKDGANK